MSPFNRAARAELEAIFNWVGANCQFYDSYWGHRHPRYKDEPDSRPAPSFVIARSLIPPRPEDWKRFNPNTEVVQARMPALRSTSVIGLRDRGTSSKQIEDHSGGLSSREDPLNA